MSVSCVNTCETVELARVEMLRDRTLRSLYAHWTEAQLRAECLAEEMRDGSFFWFERDRLREELRHELRRIDMCRRFVGDLFGCEDSLLDQRSE